MKQITLIVALVALVLVASGCTGTNTTSTEPKTPSGDFSQQESADTMSSVDQTFINDSDEVEIGQMV